MRTDSEVKYMRLLLAEDEKELSNALKAILKIKGYQIDTAGDGAEAYERVLTQSYDGIILDIMMPKMSGLEVLGKNACSEYSHAGIASHSKSRA